MAEVRHAFISPDGRARPEWSKVARRVECLSQAQTEGGAPARYDLVWIYVGARAGVAPELLGLIHRLSAAMPCIALSDFPNDDDAIAVLSAGARGYVNGQANARSLRMVGDVVLQGGLWVGESLLRRLIVGVGRAADKAVADRPAGHPNGSESPLAILTLRERQVAEAIAGGANNKEIARQLGIAERTVKSHTTTIFDKLGVDDRLKLALKIIALKK
jgi:DNA-binding NarL/FixJ family response regulator